MELGVICKSTLKDKLIEARAHDNLQVFEAGVTFAQAEGIIPAPEATHGIATAIAEAERCKRRVSQKPF